MDTHTFTLVQQLVYSAVAECQGGISKAVLAKEVCRSEQRTGEVLRELRNLGLVEATSSGRGALWALPDVAQRIRDASGRADVRARHRRLALGYRSGLRRFGKSLGPSAPAKRKVVHPNPVIPSAPASVFNLAHA